MAPSLFTGPNETALRTIPLCGGHKSGDGPGRGCGARGELWCAQPCKFFSLVLADSSAKLWAEIRRWVYGVCNPGLSCSAQGGDCCPVLNQRCPSCPPGPVGPCLHPLPLHPPQCPCSVHLHAHQRPAPPCHTKDHTEMWGLLLPVLTLAGL